MAGRYSARADGRLEAVAPPSRSLRTFAIERRFAIVVQHCDRYNVLDTPLTPEEAKLLYVLNCTGPFFCFHTADVAAAVPADADHPVAAMLQSILSKLPKDWDLQGLFSRINGGMHAFEDRTELNDYFYQYLESLAGPEWLIRFHRDMAYYPLDHPSWWSPQFRIEGIISALWHYLLHLQLCELDEEQIISEFATFLQQVYEIHPAFYFHMEVELLHGAILGRLIPPQQARACLEQIKRDPEKEAAAHLERVGEVRQVYTQNRYPVDAGPLKEVMFHIEIAHRLQRRPPPETVAALQKEMIAYLPEIEPDKALPVYEELIRVPGIVGYAAKQAYDVVRTALSGYYWRYLILNDILAPFCSPAEKKQAFLSWLEEMYTGHPFLIPDITLAISCMLPTISEQTGMDQTEIKQKIDPRFFNVSIQEIIQQLKQYLAYLKKILRPYQYHNLERIILNRLKSVENSLKHFSRMAGVS